MEEFISLYNIGIDQYTVFWVYIDQFQYYIYICIFISILKLENHLITIQQIIQLITKSFLKIF